MIHVTGTEGDGFFFCLGLLTLFTGLYFVIRDWLHTRYGYHTEGTVVELMEKWEKRRGREVRLYYPIIEFITAGQETRRFILQVGSTFRLYEVGERVEIVYYKNNIYPASAGWKVFCVMPFLIGLAILLYLMIKA